MNAYLNDKGPRMRGDEHRFECSICRAAIYTSTPLTCFNNCWNCGVKFGPEPKAEPTAGDWWYNHATGNINANSGCKANTIASVSLANPPSEQESNGLVLAASKKLLAVAKRVVECGIQTHMVVKEAQEAIAAAEGK